MKMWKFDHRHLRRLLFLPDICWFLWILPLIVQCAHSIGPTGGSSSGGGGGGGGDLWPLDRPDGMPSIQSLEVMCGKDHMDVHLSFSQPFEGIVSSKGQHGDPRCIYVHPSSGKTYFSFRIAYARCGTKPDLHGQFYENTVVVQYDKDLLEVWDEAKRLRCEWFNDYEKTASKPPMVIADLDVIQLDFRGDNVDCWMEIQHGKGPWAPPVSGIVPLGSTLTLVVAINDYRGEFDMRVKSCVASDGGGHVIQLSDEFGCVLRPKMISRFLKAKGADERASVITYAFFHAFKFPDALSVHIKCKVEICRHGCLEHCQIHPERGDVHLEVENSHYLGNEPGVLPAPNQVDRHDVDVQQNHPTNSKPLPLTPTAEDNLYDDLIHSDDSSSQEKVPESSLHQIEMNSGTIQKNSVKGERLDDRGSEEEVVEEEDQEEGEEMDGFNEALSALMPQQDALTLNQDHNGNTNLDPERDLFPHGPRYFEQLQQENEAAGTGTAAAASMGGPRSFSSDGDADTIRPHVIHEKRHAEVNKKRRQAQVNDVVREKVNDVAREQVNDVVREQVNDVVRENVNDVVREQVSDVVHEKRHGAVNRSAGTDDDDNQMMKRRRRSVVVSDRKVRSTDVGVSGLYEVISEADLAFSPDGRAEAVTVFQGKIREEVVYGICMPVPGFSVLFIMVAISAVISALVAGSLLYRYQLQKEHMAVQREQLSTTSAADVTAALPMSAFVSWVGVHLMRMRTNNCPNHVTNSSQSDNGVCETSVSTSSVNGKPSNGQINNITES